jgi:hypothetical protein
MQHYFTLFYLPSKIFHIIHFNILLYIYRITLTAEHGHIIHLHILLYIYIIYVQNQIEP